MSGLIERRADQSILPASFPIGRCWFAAVVEYAAMHWDASCFGIEHLLRGLGFETYAPAEQKMGIVRGRKMKIIRPALGPYIFVKFDRERDEWGGLRAYDHRDAVGIKGFVGLIKNNNFPIRVPDIAIDKLKQADELGLFGLSPLKPGTDVEIMNGPFAGFIGKILSATKERRAKILLKMLGTVDIDPCFLRKM